jgi:hypothetical protein
MLNPMLSKKAEKPLNPNENAKKLFQAVYRENKKASVKIDDDVPKINVSEMISKMSFYYEKIRNSVDYTEDYLLRKNAIDRILKRKIVIEGIVILSFKSMDIAKDLLIELIRAGYLPNNKIPETKIEEIAKVINKYLLLRQYSLEFGHIKFQEKSDLMNWIISVAASEIEEHLGQNLIDEAMVKYLYEVLVKNIQLQGDSLYTEEKEIQVYIGIHRNLLKFDQDMLSNILFQYYNGSWKNPTDDGIKKIAQKITSLHESIFKQINHPLAGQMNRLISRYTVFSTIMIDVIKQDPEGVYESFIKDPKAFPRLVKNACNDQYKIMKKKLWRAAIRSIVYIFLTKSIFAIALEVPATKWFGEELNTTALLINISFPALILFMIVLFTKLPSNDNTQKITEGIEEMMFIDKERKEPFKLRPAKQTGKFKNAMFGFVYTITFFLTFGAIIWALEQIGFHWVSIIIFLFFLAFVSFFSVRIRKNAKELMIIPPKENIFSFLADFFYVPIVETGKWLSEKFAKINVFVFFLDFIIEAPFKIFVDITEEWTRYVKERKDEI